MSRYTKKLSALEVSRISNPGKHPIGENLYLQITKTGQKSWLFRYSFNNKSTWMGLGSLKVSTLAEARNKATQFHRELLDGVNPLERRKEEGIFHQLEAARRVTFDECAQQYLEAHSSKWSNKKHREQWASTLKTYASPVIGKLPVQLIQTEQILNVLRPMWHEKTETASRVRGRIESVLNYARVSGYSSGENPARWRGHLDQLLPQRNKVQKVEHFEALPFDKINSFIINLRKQEGIAPRALEFTILTATRTSEALGAKWSEINFEENSWLIPAGRMKARKEHKIPLSSRALEILKGLKVYTTNDYIFPGLKIGKPLSNTSLLMTLRRMQVEVTTHGFRSTFRDWASERTNFSTEVIEMALAHTIKNKVERAYRRGDLFQKRQKLMSDWAKFCAQSKESAQVIDLGTKFA